MPGKSGTRISESLWGVSSTLYSHVGQDAVNSTKSLTCCARKMSCEGRLHTELWGVDWWEGLPSVHEALGLAPVLREREREKRGSGMW